MKWPFHRLFSECYCWWLLKNISKRQGKCYGLNFIPPKRWCIPNPQYFSMWPFLVTGRVNQVKMKSLGYALIHCDYKMGKFHTGKSVWKHMGREPCEDGGTDRIDWAASQSTEGLLVTTRSKEERKRRILLSILEGRWPVDID